MADQEIFEEPNFVLQKGAMLPVARLAYKTVGALNAARDNAVLVPSWYTGTHNDTETYMLGGMRVLDPRRYFIILTKSAAAARAVADRSMATDDWAWEVVACTSLAHVRHKSPLPCMKSQLSLSVPTFVGN
jgi:hypothetical protein